MDIQKPEEIINRIRAVSMRNHRNNKHLMAVFKYVRAKHKIKTGNNLRDLRFSPQCHGVSSPLGCDAVMMGRVVSDHAGFIFRVSSQRRRSFLTA
jgi:hypothetical protein